MSEGFFSPGSILWQVDREMALLASGGRAILMQLAHPKVAAGVADHSRFKEDPFGRLHRTMESMWSLVFDEREEAEASLERVKEAHQRVKGTVKKGEAVPEGTPYDAFDPDLLFWVHATLVDSALCAYGLFVRPLSDGEKERYYEDSKQMARLFEIPEDRISPSMSAFEDYMKGMLRGGEISVGPAARELARDILRPRRPFLFKMGGPLNAFLTVGLLPPELRRAYGFSWNERKQRKLVFLARSSRTLLPLLPACVRLVPHARRAQKRIRRMS